MFNPVNERLFISFNNVTRSILEQISPSVFIDKLPKNSFSSIELQYDKEQS